MDQQALDNLAEDMVEATVYLIAFPLIFFLSPLP